MRTLLTEKGAFDPGNYSRTTAAAHGLIGSAMREAGDEELALAALSSLQERYDTYVDDRGWLMVETASGYGHAEIGHAMMVRKGTWLNMMTKGMPEHWRNGPLLDAVPYPDVLVGRAVSNDGTDLEVVLHAGRGGGRFAIELCQLTPGVTYQARGAAEPEFTAGPGGTARVEVDVDRRTELHVVPA